MNSDVVTCLGFILCQGNNHGVSIFQSTNLPREHRERNAKSAVVLCIMLVFLDSDSLPVVHV